MLNTSNRNIRRIDRLYALAEENNIPVDENCPDALISMSVRFSDGSKVIGMSKTENATHSKLECLAHEMGHCMTDSFYAGYSPFERRAKHENRANAWAVNEIIPFPGLCKAVKKGCHELWQLAEYFEVSIGFVEKAIKIHKDNGNTVPEHLYKES